MTDALIIGAGPAGLMAAETIADAGFSVVIADAKPSFGRKFLMAGKSGLNLTKHEPLEQFLSHYEDDWIKPIVSDFSPTYVSDWARGLGQEVFTGSSNRVFPKTMKASPLLRAWLNRLRSKGVSFQTRYRWIDWNNGAVFETPQGRKNVEAKIVVIACGGSSWARLGSDGKWASILLKMGVQTTPFQPINMGFDVAWSAHMKPYFGQPVKPLRLKAGNTSVRGEIVLSNTGIEGGGIYTLSKHLRNGASLELDLAPDVSAKDLAQKITKQSPKASRANLLRKALKLSPTKLALINECARDAKGDDLVWAVKSLRIPLLKPRPMDEAISTSGGVPYDALTSDLMLKHQDGVFCAGEMLDWDAPTGGYLITACLATGHRAGLGAVAHLRGR